MERIRICNDSALYKCTLNNNNNNNMYVVNRNNATDRADSELLNSLVRMVVAHPDCHGTLPI